MKLSSLECSHCTAHSEAVQRYYTGLYQCCVHNDIELITCDSYHQLKDCSTWKEPGLVGYFFFSASELPADKHAVTILDIVFGCYTAGSIGPVSRIIH